MNFEIESQQDEFKDPEHTISDIEESVLFNERLEQFNETDLTIDADGTWNTFEQKIKDVFPELSGERLRAMKTAVSMHLCGL